MYIRYLAAAILASFLMLATPEPVKADTAIAYIDIQPQITQLSENLTTLTEKSQIVEAGIRLRVDKNASLDLAIAKKKIERDQVSATLAGLNTSITEYSNRVNESERQIFEYKNKISAINQAKRQAVSNCGPLLEFFCKPLADLISEISGLESQIRDAQRVISSTGEQLRVFQRDLDQSQGEYNQLSAQLTELEQHSQVLTTDMKRGKKLLMDANTLSRDLNMGIDQSEELKEGSLDRKVSQRRLAEIAQLNQKARKLLQSVDVFLLNNA